MGRFKAGLQLDVDPRAKVGESWEISAEPSFPSMLESGDLLVDVIRSDPRGWLGERIAAEHDGCPLLVKLIDAAENLSVQVHPPEDHALLSEGETGKTEAWIILGAASGARIYVGFLDGVEKADVDACLTAGGVLADLMNAVVVQEGQVYYVRPGLVHALGAGITVLEPQHVRPHRRSITYRFWDWNRLYDAGGHVSAAGVPRPLHIQEALAVTDWSGPRGEALIESCRREPVPLPADGALQRWQLLDEPELWAQRSAGTGSFPLPKMDTLLALLCLDGEVELTDGAHSLRLQKGQSAVVPAAIGDVRVELNDARLEMCCVPASPDSR
jgi:mannose-6-phosphate isomerase